MNTGAEGKGWGRGGQAVTCAAPVYTWALLGWKGPQQGHQRGGFMGDKEKDEGRNKARPYCLGFGEGGGPSTCLGGRAPSSQHFPLAGGEGGDGERQPAFPTSPEPAVSPAELGGISQLCLKWGDRAHAGARGCLPAWRSSAYPLLLQGR